MLGLARWQLQRRNPSSAFARAVRLGRAGAGDRRHASERGPRSSAGHPRHPRQRGLRSGASQGDPQGAQIAVLAFPQPLEAGEALAKLRLLNTDLTLLARALRWRNAPPAGTRRRRRSHGRARAGAFAGRADDGHAAGSWVACLPGLVSSDPPDGRDAPACGEAPRSARACSARCSLMQQPPQARAGGGPRSAMERLRPVKSRAPVRRG